MRFAACAERLARRSRIEVFAYALCFACCSAGGQELEWAGYVSTEPRIFFDAPAFSEQDDSSVVLSGVAAPELRYEWNGGDDRITFAPYARFDESDSERNHLDLREANWLHFAGPWTFRLGVGRVFWGVTESRHLVDIINQTDLVEDIDEEDKLGQPMINVDRYTSWGSFGLFVMPGFRERTFPADDARLRGPVPISSDRAQYESSEGDGHTDWALRWNQTLGRWDLGASAFFGTTREPRLMPTVPGVDRLVLIPQYDIIRQVGVDVQYTREAWLWKLEAIRRSGQGNAFSAVVAGFEYTLFGLGSGNTDLGVLTEFLYDGRKGVGQSAVLDDDLFFGLRLALNDVSDTMLLFGVIHDRDEGGGIMFLEGQRRLWERWRFETELRWLADAKGPELSGFQRDSFVSVRLARYF
jgi:hypothetical protein